MLGCSSVSTLMVILCQYPGTAFKVPMLSQWLVVISGPKMVDDIRRASPDQVDGREAIAEVSIYFPESITFSYTLFQDHPGKIHYGSRTSAKRLPCSGSTLSTYKKPCGSLRRSTG